MKWLESYSFGNYSVYIIRMQEYPLTSRPCLLKLASLGKKKKKMTPNIPSLLSLAEYFFCAKESPGSTLG